MTGPNENHDATALRGLYRRHENLIEGAADRLIPGVARRLRKQRIATRSTVGAALVVVIVAVVGITLFIGRAPSTVDHGPPPAGYKWGHALGVEVAVPQAWDISEGFYDSACSGGDGRPGLVLPGKDGIIGQSLCADLFTDYGDIAFVTTAQVRPADVLTIMPYGVTPRPILIDGIPALRESGSVGLGGPEVYEGFVIISSRNVSVWVRTADLATLTEILDNVHLLSR